jgi:hypothetical protein
LNLVHIYMWNADFKRGRGEIQRALQLIGTEPSPALYQLLMLKASTFGVTSDMESAFTVLAEAGRVLEALPAPPSDGFGPMLETHVLFEAARIAVSQPKRARGHPAFRVASVILGEAEVFEAGRRRHLAGADQRSGTPAARRHPEGGTYWARHSVVALLGLRLN